MGTRRRNNVGKESNQPLPTHFSRKSSASNKCKLEFRHVLFGIIGLVIGYFVSTVYWNWYKSKFVYTPFATPSKNYQYNDMNKFWGTYRPQVYMGMKTKSPQSLVTGLMWLRQNVRYTDNLPLRHVCEQGDHLLRYGWVAHDGVNFGIQDIVERGFVVRTEFVKKPGGNHGGDWTWRLSGVQSGKDPVTLSMIFYAATDSQGNIIPVTSSSESGKQLTAIYGKTDELGQFTIKFPEQEKKLLYHTVTTKAEGLHKITDAALQKMQVSSEKGNFLYFLKDSAINSDPKNSKSDVTAELPFELEVVFESKSNKERSEMLAGSAFTRALTKLKNKFDQKFEARFPLKNKGYNEAHIGFAKAALSNLVGGVGHFYGHSYVQSEYQSKPVKNWDSHLVTAVPSRSFFPRGFLWDEGFHELLVGKWDRSLSMEVISSWLDLINVEGWIPREQILDSEARSKVPDEFVVQRNTNANPPTLFLAIESLVQSFDKDMISDSDRKFLRRIYPKLKLWYDWFNSTQSGSLPTTYRWRGRTEGSDAELNPKTLTSGLDDYPRASHPSSEERHVDLRCWMALASSTMSRMARVLYGDNSAEAALFAETFKQLTDIKLLNKLHWSNEMGLYSDYGNHTDRVGLVRKTFQPSQQGQRPYTKVVRVERQKPSPRFVNAYGYVSLFPFLLQLLPADSQQLNQILLDLKGEDALWTKYGLRSLSKRDPLYKKRNTEHDPPYWRGQIWININFLAVRALKYYSKQPGPYSEIASQLYTSLRHNIVENMFSQYSKTGYLWENYDDLTGRGQGSHPFTGWSSLVVLIMSEQY